MLIGVALASTFKKFDILIVLFLLLTLNKQLCAELMIDLLGDI